MTHESWKPVVGYESRYEVSDLGHIRIIGIDHIGRRRCIGRVLKVGVTRGYAHVLLHQANSRRNKMVHILVMEAFLGPKPAGFDVNHLNGIKTDNRLANLEYCTRSQNYRHALDVLKFQPPRGAVHWAAKLTDDSVREIRRRYATGEFQKSIAVDFGIRQNVVSKIVNRQSWKHVP